MKPAARRIEERERHAESHYQLKLGNKSLLSLFLALAVVCGTFFAFGYTLGKHAIPASFRLGSAPVATSSALGNPPAPAPGVQPPNPQALGAAESDQTPTSLTTPSPTPAGGTTAEATPPTANPVPLQASATEPPAADSTGGSTAKPVTSSSGVFEVQVFAGVQADAQSLATALKAKGYPANVVAPSANGSDDFYRVQVGPYLTSAEAQAMRSRLVADGYQAVVKQ